MQTLRYRQSNPTTETTITLQIKNHRFSPVVFTHLPNTILSNMNLVLDTKSIVHHTDLKVPLGQVIAVEKLPQVAPPQHPEQL
jgi:hypothetical protein